jgi:hypothetical protein
MGLAQSLLCYPCIKLHIQEKSMPELSSFIDENKASRELLAEVVSGLTDADLSQLLDAGWTVSAVLAHLAFWDYRALILIRKWKKAGIGPSPVDIDVVNEVTRVLCLGIPPRATIDLVSAQALAIDQEIEQLDEALAADIAARGQTVRLDRGKHRREHLRQIEETLGKKDREST